MQALGLDISIKKVEKSRLPEIDFNNLPFGKIYSDHMLVADYKDGHWGDVQIVPFENLSLNPATSALHYGQAIFEGLKAFRSESEEGKILVFRPWDNARRMNESAKRLCMPPIPEEIFLNGLKALLNLDKGWVPPTQGAALYIRPFMFATDAYTGMRPSQTYKFIIFTCPVGAYYSQPVKVKVERHFSRSMEGGTGAAKCAGNYGGSLYPAQLAQQQGFDQLLWTDSKEHKYIEESGTMNVLFLIGDKLITAPTSYDTILDGVTRKSVLALAKEWGLTVEERHLAVDELIAAHQNGTLKEAFGAGTAATIAPIALVHCDGKDYQLPEERPFASKMLAALTGIQRGKVADTNNWNFKI